MIDMLIRKYLSLPNRPNISVPSVEAGVERGETRFFFLSSDLSNLLYLPPPPSSSAVLPERGIDPIPAVHAVPGQVQERSARRVLWRSSRGRGSVSKFDYPNPSPLLLFNSQINHLRLAFTISPNRIVEQIIV